MFYYLFDLENENENGIFNAVPDDATIVLFHSLRVKMIPIDIIEYKGNIETVKVHSSIHNAMDAKICEYIWEHEKNDENEFFIVSNDKDFDKEIMLMKDKGINVERYIFLRTEMKYQNILNYDKETSKLEKEIRLSQIKNWLEQDPLIFSDDERKSLRKNATNKLGEATNNFKFAKHFCSGMQANLAGAILYEQQIPTELLIDRFEKKVMRWEINGGNIDGLDNFKNYLLSLNEIDNINKKL